MNNFFPPHLRIQPLQVDDVALIQAAFPQGGFEKHQERLDRQELGRVTYLIAWRGNQPAGHLLVKWQRPPDDLIEPHLAEPCPDFEDLFVLEELRSQGIGSQLLAHAEALARDRGFRQVGLSAEVEVGDRARRLYERLGYCDAVFGEFTERYEYVDEAGQFHLWEGVCIYLIKPLP